MITGSDLSQVPWWSLSILLGPVAMVFIARMTSSFLFYRAIANERTAPKWWLDRTEVSFQSDLQRLRSRQHSVGFVLAIVSRLLPPSERARYLEEYLAELLDLPCNSRLRHAVSLLRGAFVLRLRRGLKNTAGDVAVRRVKD
jgi:hypothetical protein